MVKLVDEMKIQGYEVTGHIELYQVLAEKITEEGSKYKDYFKQQLKKVDPKNDEINNYLGNQDGAAVEDDTSLVSKILSECLQKDCDFKYITELTGIPMAYYSVHPEGDNKGKLNLVAVNYNPALTKDPVRVSPNQNNIPVNAISVVILENGSMALVSKEQPIETLESLKSKSFDVEKEVESETKKLAPAYRTAEDLGEEDVVVVFETETPDSPQVAATRSPGTVNAIPVQPNTVNHTGLSQESRIFRFLDDFHKGSNIAFHSDDTKKDFINRFTNHATASVTKQQSEDGKQTYFKGASGDIVTQEKGNDGKIKFTDIKKSCTVMLKHEDGKGFDLLAFDKDGKIVNHQCEGDPSKSRLDIKWLAVEKQKAPRSVGEDAAVLESRGDVRNPLPASNPTLTTSSSRGTDETISDTLSALAAESSSKTDSPTPGRVGRLARVFRSDVKDKTEPTVAAVLTKEPTSGTVEPRTAAVSSVDKPGATPTKTSTRGVPAAGFRR